MTTKQLDQIKQFSKKFYLKNDQFHDWAHPILTTKYALMLAKNYKDADLKILEATCYLHDIGRINVDEGHPYESARLAKPFLKKIGLSAEEAESILHAVSIHAMEDIHKAKTIEAKLLFDADKIQILSVYGFIRVYSFLVVERKWKMERALDFMYDYIKKVFKNHMQTKEAIKMLTPEIKKIDQFVLDFKRGISAKL